jgi:hypothetical protein
MPAAPITSLQKRIAKGIEQLYYVRLFSSSPAYADGDIWRRWHEHGFHVATFAPPPGMAAGDRIRVRSQGPSPTPVISVDGANVDALKDLESVLHTIDQVRPTVAGRNIADRATALRAGELGRVLAGDLVGKVQAAGLGQPEVDDFLAMLQRGFDALTNDEITAIDVTLS